MKTRICFRTKYPRWDSNPQNHYIHQAVAEYKIYNKKFMKRKKPFFVSQYINDGVFFLTENFPSFFFFLETSTLCPNSNMQQIQSFHILI